MNERDLAGRPKQAKNSQLSKKPPLVFHEHNSKQATKDDLLDVCRALGLKVTTNSAPLASVRMAMRSRLVELNEAGILPPDEDT